MVSDGRFRELVVGTEGLALLRNAVDGDKAFRRRRMDEIRRVASEYSDVPNDDAVPELDPVTAYRSWSTTYDSLPNGMIEIEEPVVHALLDAAPPGRALDAACGTGRHAAALVARGYETIGIDQSPEMLDVAREKVAGAEFRQGQLQDLPAEDDCVDVAICALALTHLADISPAVTELARVVRPGGRVIISDNHPMTVLLQNKLLFAGADGRLGFMRYHLHLIGRCLEIFQASGLSVRSCREPLFSGRLTPGGFEQEIADAARAAWEGFPSAIVWELDVASQ